MDDKRKKQLKWLLIYTIIFWVTTIALILYLIPAPAEEPSEFEIDLGWQISNRLDLRFVAGVMGIIWYSFGAIGIFVYHSRKNKNKK